MAFSLPSGDVFSLASYFMGGILNILIMVLVITFFVKLVMAVISSVKAGTPWGKKGKGGDDDDPTKKKGDGDGDSKKSKAEKDIEEFEDGIENPAYLKVWVRSRDGQGIKGARVSIIPSKKKFFSVNRAKKRWKVTDEETNADGVFPGHDYLRVPSGIPIKIEVNYWLPRSLKYRTEKRGIFSLGLGKKRWFNPNPTVYTFGAGEKKELEIVLAIDAEESPGFEPHIENVDYKTTPGRIKTRGIVKSMTGELTRSKGWRPKWWPK